MRPFDLAVLPPVWILTLLGLRGLRTAPRRNRVLWTVWACWAVSTTLGAPAVRRVVDALLGVVSVTNLLVHLVGLAATATMLEFVREMTGRARGRVSRLNMAGLAVASCALTAAFLVMPRPGVDTELSTYSEGPPAGYLYWVVLTGDLAIGLAAFARLCWVHGKHAGPGPVRTSLWLMRIATLLGAAGLTHRLVHLNASQFGWPNLQPAAAGVVTEALMALAPALFALSVLWPSLAEYRQKRVAVRQADRIAPLWRLLQAATPEVVLPLPEELRRNNPRLRLYRYVIEIRDSVFALEGHLSEALLAAAEERLRAGSIADGQLAPAVEAVLLRYAMTAELEGRDQAPGGRLRPCDEQMDLDAEIRWFQRVAAAIELPAVVAAARELGAPGAPVSGAPGGGGGGEGEHRISGAGPS
ncbi:MAB_1171c family putative transporter [Kitasatospora sp. NPDC015120]|uniref:MAB_1171c family putative transporter n=1 Tax=Kitasatospora sp. NPDC015120 TaxID=3364023 RepID=UPI0036F476F8